MNQSESQNNKNQNGQENPQNTNIEISQNKTSIMNILNKLKETQNRIYETKYKLNIIHSKNQKFEKKKFHHERRKNLSMEIGQFIQKQKEKKYQYLDIKTVALEQQQRKNETIRKNHKERLQFFKQTIEDNHKWVYQQTKKQRQANQKLINTCKKKQLTDKRKKRQQLFLNEKTRLKNVQQYLKNKRYQSIEQKNKETDTLKSRVEQRQQVLLDLQFKGSRASLALREKSQESFSRFSDEKSRKPNEKETKLRKKNLDYSIFLTNK